MRTFQRGRVIDTIASDRYHVLFRFQDFDNSAFLIRSDAREDNFRRVKR